ncbi:hypothetical protein K1719_046360 [Acacia pycnantha]|nr:hypothetical protein K1719_046360 [Acacia pycnantha]
MSAEIFVVPFSGKVIFFLAWSYANTYLLETSKSPWSFLFTVAFFTSGAGSIALEYAIGKANPEDLKPSEIRLLPGLPDDVALTPSDLKRRPPDHPPPLIGGGPAPDVGAWPRMRGPPKPGDHPPFLEHARKTNATMINTCDDLERPFIEYIAKQTGKPIWGVGPLRPSIIGNPQALSFTTGWFERIDSPMPLRMK